MQHYGLILADNGSNWYFQGSAYPQWPDALVSLLKQIPAKSFRGGQRILPHGHTEFGPGQSQARLPDRLQPPGPPGTGIVELPL